MIKKLKVCSKCQKEKPVSEFNKHKNRKDGLQTVCKDCNKLRSRKYYSDNKEKHKKIISARKLKHVQSIREFLFKYLQEHGCADCGEKDPVVLEFDHQHSKLKNISILTNRGCGLKKIKQEIEKCEVRCANCHRRKTAKDFNWWKFTVQQPTELWTRKFV